MSLEELKKMIESDFPKVLKGKGFKLAYEFERPYPRHIRIGYLSERLKIKLLFVYEWKTSLYIGTEDNLFDDEMGWFYFEHLLDFMFKRSIRWGNEKTDKPYKEFLADDLANIGREFQENCDQILLLFRDKAEVKEWESDFRNYVSAELERRYHQKKT